MIRSGVDGESDRLARARERDLVRRRMVDRHGLGPASSDRVAGGPPSASLRSALHGRLGDRRAHRRSGGPARRLDRRVGAAAALDRTVGRRARRAARAGRARRVGAAVARPRRAPSDGRGVDRCVDSCCARYRRGSLVPQLVHSDAMARGAPTLPSIYVISSARISTWSRCCWPATPATRARSNRRPAVWRRIAVSRTPAADARGGHDRPEPRARTRTRRGRLWHRRTRTGGRNGHALGERRCARGTQPEREVRHIALHARRRTGGCRPRVPTTRSRRPSSAWRCCSWLSSSIPPSI